MLFTGSYLVSSSKYCHSGRVLTNSIHFLQAFSCSPAGVVVAAPLTICLHSGIQGTIASFVFLSNQATNKPPVSLPNAGFSAYALPRSADIRISKYSIIDASAENTKVGALLCPLLTNVVLILFFSFLFFFVSVFVFFCCYKYIVHEYFLNAFGIRITSQFQPVSRVTIPHNICATLRYC